MRIGLDAKRAFCNRTGLGNYSRNVIRALAEHLPGHDYVLFTPYISIPEFVEELKKYPQVSIVSPGKKGIAGAVWRSRGVVKELKKNSIDLYHGLSNELPKGIRQSGVKAVVTIHDLIPFKEKSFHNPLDRWIYQAKMQSAVTAADAVVAISKQTESELHSILHVPASKTKVVYQPVNPEFLHPVSEYNVREVAGKYQLPPHFMLLVGRVEMRKNIQNVLLAMTEMGNASAVHLVCVGRKTKFYSSLHSYIHNFKLTERVHFLESVSFDDLPAIYAASDMVVYPSFMEGFGLPVAEALAMGKPVLTTRGGCFEEAGGDAAFYTHPEKPREIAENILYIESSAGQMEDRIANGRIHVQQFMPVHIAAALEKVYTSVR